MYQDSTPAQTTAVAVSVGAQREIIDRVVFLFLLRLSHLRISRTREPSQQTIIQVLALLEQGQEVVVAQQNSHIFLDKRQEVVPERAVLGGDVLLDCADGMLARWRNQQSTAGHLFDFLMDEIKAFAILAACAVRLWLDAGRDDTYLLVGMFGLVSLSTGVALTTFVRRSEIEPPRPTISALSTPPPP